MMIKTSTTAPVFDTGRTRPHMSVSALSLAGETSVFGDRGTFGVNAAADARGAVVGSGQPAWSPPV